jgi:hypothetical protein
MMRATHSYWMNKCVHPENVITKVAVDSKEDAEYLPDFDVIISDNPGGVVKPLNDLLGNFKGEPGDILIVPSDDFYPPSNWDMYLEHNFRNFKGLLKVNDGHMDDIISIPILKYEAFEQLNRTIYHPAYSHMFCDKELHDSVWELGICKAVSMADPEWVHKHPVFGTRKMDKSDERNTLKYSEGKEIYSRRRYLSLRERLEV